MHGTSVSNDSGARSASRFFLGISLTFQAWWDGHVSTSFQHRGDEEFRKDSDPALSNASLCFRFQRDEGPSPLCTRGYRFSDSNSRTIREGDTEGVLCPAPVYLLRVRNPEATREQRRSGTKGNRVSLRTRKTQKRGLGMDFKALTLHTASVGPPPIPLIPPKTTSLCGSLHRGH